MTRKTRIALSSVAVACFLAIIALDSFTGTTRPLFFLHVFVLLSQAYLLVQLIRGKPLPALTLDRLRALRRQNAVGAVVWLDIGVLLVLVWRGSEDEDRGVYLWLGTALLLSAIASVVSSVRLSLALRRGEVPVRLRRRWEAVSRRRTS